MVSGMFLAKLMLDLISTVSAFSTPGLTKSVTSKEWAINIFSPLPTSSPLIKSVKKVKRIEREIKKIAKEVLNSKIEAKLDPMNSYERRIVHTIISNFEKLETESFGQDPMRYVVIRYK